MFKSLVSLSVIAFISFSALAGESKIIQKLTPFPGSVIYMPNDGKAHPGVMVLHGSEGGSLPYAQLEAQYLAAHGYIAMAFCWYSCARNPITSPLDTLENVELRKSIQAIQWFKNFPGLSGRLALFGASRGAELALILGSIEESGKLLDAVAVHTPSDVVVAGFSWGVLDSRCWVCTTFDLSCFNGTSDFQKWNWEQVRWNPACGTAPQQDQVIQAWLLDGKALPIGSAIEVEKFQKPIFITVGDQDELWDYKQSLRVTDRLKKFHQPVELHVFPGEHHVFSVDKANEKHQMLLKFLQKNLK